MNRFLASLLLASCFLTTTGANCTSTIFPALGTNLSAPIAISVDAANARAYVVNSNNRVEFNGASLSILDISSPAAPTLLSNTSNPITIDNFSGQIYVDTTNRFAYIANRLSTDPLDTSDVLLKVNLDESSSSLATITSNTAGNNPFGVACCDASDRVYAVSSGGTVEVYNKLTLAYTQVSLAVTLDEGAISGASATEAAFNSTGTLAFISNRAGQVYILNTSEIGDASKNPIDYVIKNVQDARGLALDATNLYVVDGTAGTALLRVIPTATLTPITPDTTAISQPDATTLQTTTVPLGNDPNEIILFGGKAYVSNRGDDTISVIDLSNLSATPTTIAVGDEPYGLAAFTSGADSFLYVTNLASNTISVINLASNTVVATFP